MFQKRKTLPLLDHSVDISLDDPAVRKVDLAITSFSHLSAGGRNRNVCCITQTFVAYRREFVRVDTCGTASWQQACSSRRTTVSHPLTATGTSLTKYLPGLLSCVCLSRSSRRAAALNDGTEKPMSTRAAGAGGSSSTMMRLYTSDDSPGLKV